MCYIWHTECLEQTLFFQWWAGMASQPQPTGINSILLETSSLSFFFFLTPLLFLKRELSETSDFCLLLPISCPFCGSVVQPQYGAEGWCQVRGNRPLYSLAGASGTPVGKTFSLKILLGLAPMLWMCHSKEAPHFNLFIRSLLISFLYQTLLHVLLFCLLCFSLKIIIQIFCELPHPWSYLLLFESSEVPSLWDGWRWLDHSSLLKVVPQICVKILYLFIVLQPILSVCLLYLHTKTKSGWHLGAKAVI